MKLLINALITITAFNLFTATAAPKSAATLDQLFFVAGKKGIASYRMNSATGGISDLGITAEALNPQFLAIHPSRPFLFTLNSATIDGKKTGVVSSFSIEPKTGQLTFLNQQSSGGAGPTHLVVDHVGKNVLVANYGGGSIAAFPIQEDGSLKAASAFVQHSGSSVNPQRQEGPHAHGILPDPKNRFALVCDLGLDKVLVYKFDSAKGSLLANEPAFVSLKPGAGPRHHAFSPTGKNLYVINELDSTVTVFDYKTKDGTLKEIQNISTLPKDFSGKTFPAEIAVHPSGKFVYGSNRGHDSIAIFSADKKTGQLTFVGTQPTKGKWPRHFEIDPTGKFLLAENEHSGDIFVFKIDLKSGGLTPTEASISVEGPQCVKFFPAKK